MDVLQREQERRVTARRPDEPGERLDEREARLLRIARRRARRAGDVPAHVGRDGGQSLEAGAERLLEPAQVVAAAQLVDDLPPGPERGRAAAFPAAAPHGIDALVRRLLREAPDKRRLADAALAGDEHEAAAPAPGVGERDVELGQFALATAQDGR